MEFAQRLKLFLIGFSIGIVLIAVFFGGRAFQCSYFPNARVLDEAKIYPLVLEDGPKMVAEKEHMDSLFFANELFKKSKVTNLGTDEVNAKPCRIYRATYQEKKQFDFVYKICNKKTIITELIEK